MDFSRFRFKSNYVNIFFLGIVTAFLIFLPSLITDKGLFLYYGDFNVQQIPFYRLAHDAIRSGATGWNWNTDLGVNFVGSYSFYLLGSPFFWVTLLFPNAALPYLMAPLLILKFGLTAVTSYGFIKRFTRLNSTAMMGALMYAFCGFNIYNIFFNHFNEVVVIFPLLLIALEELVQNNRRGPFALVVGLSALVNYYFFFGEVIFVIIYFLFRCTDPKFNITISKFFTIVFEAVIGLLLSAILLLPAIIAISGNTRLDDFIMGYDMLFYNKPQRYGQILASYFFPPDMPARPNFFPDSDAKWASVSMFLPLLSMVGVVAFFKGVGLKKHWARGLIGLCVIFTFIPVLNSMFSAFNYAYYGRWFFMPLLIMALVSCIALEKYNKHLSYGVKFCAIFVGAIAMIGILPKKIDDKIVFFKLPEYPDRFWGYVGISVVCLLISYLLYVMTIKYKHFAKISIISVCCISVVSGMFMIFLGKMSGDGYETIAVKALGGEKNITLPEDNQFFRIDTYDELDNLGMYWGMPTINAFHSIVPAPIMDYYQKTGGERGVGSRPKPEFIGVRALNSVKYSFISDDKPIIPMPGFDYFDTQNGYKIYENKYYIPMGFTFQNAVTEDMFEQNSSTRKDRVLLKAMVLSEDDYAQYQHLFEPFDYDDEASSVGSDAGYFEACEELIATSGSEFSYDSDGFTSKMNNKNASLAFFSVPFDKGWSAYVNGAKVDIVKANLGFMAVPVPVGNNVIRFEYQTPGLILGIIITGVAAIILLAYILVIHNLRKKRIIALLDKNAHLRANDCVFSTDCDVTFVSDEIIIDDKLIAHSAYIGRISRTKKVLCPTPTSAESPAQNVESTVQNDASVPPENEM